MRKEDWYDMKQLIVINGLVRPTINYDLMCPCDKMSSFCQSTQCIHGSDVDGL